MRSPGRPQLGRRPRAKQMDPAGFSAAGSIYWESNIKNGASSDCVSPFRFPHVVLAGSTLAPDRDGIRAKVMHDGNTQEVIASRLAR